MKTEKQFIPLAVEPFLLSDKMLSAVLSCSVAHVHNLDNKGKIPKAINLGKCKRWGTDQIRKWCDAGCPNRVTWLQMKEAKNGGNK